jgi:hypothetical protein
MLPASFQLPAAVLLLFGGLIACFAGYRMFRVVLGIYGFILGALIGTSIVGTGDAWLTILVGALGGLLGALILILAYFIGVALIGAGLGALGANLLWAQLGGEPHPLLVVLFAVVGALVALALQRYVIIVSTSFGGAWTAILGGLGVLGQRGAWSSAPTLSGVWLAFPSNPFPGQERIVTIGWIALSLVGLIVQVTVTAKGRK